MALQFTGQLYDGSGSQKIEVRVELNRVGQLQVIEQSTCAQLFSLGQDEINVSSRLANTPRYLQLPDGQSIETLDNDAVDQWIKQFRPHPLQGFLHRIESHLGFVFLTLLVVIAFVWGSIQYGIPAASNSIAKRLPANLLDIASEQTLEMLESNWLEPSQLPPERQQALLDHFANDIKRHPELRIQVVFRSSELMGPNAFALPNGMIIFTDQIVNLAEHDDELVAVLAHEIGHIKYQHSLRQIIQNSLLYFTITMMTGDLSSSSDLLVTLPILFMELSYSREYETEADDYARHYMTNQGIPLHRFADLMNRLKDSTPYQSTGSFQEQGDSSHWQRYLSTHPLTDERIESFQE